MLLLPCFIPYAPHVVYVCCSVSDPSILQTLTSVPLDCTTVREVATTPGEGTSALALMDTSCTHSDTRVKVHIMYVYAGLLNLISHTYSPPKNTRGTHAKL